MRHQGRRKRETRIKVAFLYPLDQEHEEEEEKIDKTVAIDINQIKNKASGDIPVSQKQ